MLIALGGILFTIRTASELWGILRAFLFVPAPTVFGAGVLAGLVALLHKGARHASKRAVYGALLIGMALAEAFVGLYLVIGSSTSSVGIQGILEIGALLFLIGAVGAGFGVLVGGFFMPQAHEEGKKEIHT